MLADVRALSAPLAAFSLLMAVVGCGGSGPSSGSSGSSSATSAPAARTSSAVGAASTATQTTTPATGTASRPGGGAPPPKTGPGGSGSGGSGSGGAGLSAPGESSNARVPAAFTLAASGRLNPPTISIPAFLAVAFSVRSASSTPHDVRLMTPRRHGLSVPAHGSASVLVPGLRAGSYPIEVDGVRHGTLAIGGEPGP